MRTLPMLTLAAALAPFGAFAGTPDDIEPVREPPCDKYRGATKASCQAYCESEDCNDPRVRAADPACQAHVKKFFRLTGETQMPCDIPEPPPPTCTVNAEDDFLDMNDPQSFVIQAFSNDAATPTTATITVATHTAPSDIVVDATAGTFSGTWTDPDNTYRREFQYTACCATDVCDTATVTILGS